MRHNAISANNAVAGRCVVDTGRTLACGFAIPSLRSLRGRRPLQSLAAFRKRYGDPQFCVGAIHESPVRHNAFFANSAAIRSFVADAAGASPVTTVKRCVNVLAKRGQPPYGFVRCLFLGRGWQPHPPRVHSAPSPTWGGTTVSHSFNNRQNG